MTADSATPPARRSAPELRWGVLGPGTIARRFVDGVAGSRTGRLVAVASRDGDRARAFVEEHAGATKGADTRAYAGYQPLLDDDGVDAVYIATPHPFHPRWAIAAARAGKHLLVEKPVGVNRAQAQAVFDAARANEVFALEAYMYRCHPQIARVVELVTDGAIGRVHAIDAAFAFKARFDPTSRAFDRALAGGGILVVGGYPVSFARLVAGASLAADGAPAPFADPVAVTGGGTLGASGVDEWAVGTLTFDNGVTAAVSTGVGLTDHNGARVTGTGGYLQIPKPWVPPDHAAATLVLHRVGHDPETIEVPAGHLYSYEVDEVADHLGDRQSPLMSWADSLGNLAVMDTWRELVGVRFDQDDEAADQVADEAADQEADEAAAPGRSGAAG